MSGVWIHMAATSSTMQSWHLELATPLLTFPSSSTCAPPTCRAQTALRAVNKPNKDGLNAKPPGTSDGSEGAHEHDVVYPYHVSTYFSTSSAVTSESLVGQLFPLH